MTNTRQLSQRLEEMGKRLRDLDLTDEEVKRIDEEISRLDQLVVPSKPKTRSVLEWWGVGKELWAQIDVDEYIRKERESWR